MLNPADGTFARDLAAQLPPGTVGQAGPAYLQEPRRRGGTASAVLARPRDTQEVARIVRACSAARVGIVPWGGGSGLVLGQVVPDGPAPLILSLERMNGLRGIWPDENVIVAEAGAILADVQAAAEAAGRLFPLAIAAQGSARIGGNLATNAGGVAVLRYGNARDLCLGIEAVLPDGTVLNGLQRLRKDNTGYDLRHLLIGSEGTLAVITAAALKLFARPAGVGTALFSVAGPEAALALLALAQDLSGGGVSSFELIHRQGLLFLDEVMPEFRQPWTERPEWSVLAEIGLPPGLEPEAVLGAIFARAEAGGLARDGLIAQSLAQRQGLWALRENLPEANRRIGAIASHDIALPLSRIGAFIREATARVARLGQFRINCFGHVGDGNLHFNIFPPKGIKREELSSNINELQSIVHETADAFGGTISAEHGIGRLKVAELEKFGDPAKLAAMRAIKAALDPRGIMNPGAVLRR
ncbi:MAG: FAD-binding oxidoreductase [Rhodobacteraceae bacterium]|nr:FAD-binding oxidoreductase [Paracoccaceae bacterium]